MHGHLSLCLSLSLSACELMCLSSFLFPLWSSVLFSAVWLFLSVPSVIFFLVFCSVTVPVCSLCDLLSCFLQCVCLPVCSLCDLLSCFLQCVSSFLFPLWSCFLQCVCVPVCSLCDLLSCFLQCDSSFLFPLWSSFLFCMLFFVLISQTLSPCLQCSFTISLSFASLLHCWMMILKFLKTNSLHMQIKPIVMKCWRCYARLSHCSKPMCAVCSGHHFSTDFFFQMYCL